MLKRLLLDEDGQTMTEYILIIALVAIAVFAVLRIFGGKIRALFQKASGKLEEAGE
jgi:Flp pilus assembly pilin Flp